MEEWVGETDCENYRGIIKRTELSCCGGKRMVRILVGCKPQGDAYADSACHKATCPIYRESIHELGSPSIPVEKLP